MTNDTTAPERLVNTQTDEALRVQGSVLASAAHLSTQRFQGWGNPVVASCKDAADMIGALASERDTIRSRLEAAQARIAELEGALDQVMIGGNHLALIIGPDHPTYTEDHDSALNYYGAGVQFNAWCCWKSIMEAKATLEGKG